MPVSVSNPLLGHSANRTSSQGTKNGRTRCYINAKGKHSNYTPLTIASRNEHLDVVQYLVKQGTDIHAKSVDGHTALILRVGIGILMW